MCQAPKNVLVLRNVKYDVWNGYLAFYVYDMST